MSKLRLTGRLVFNAAIGSFHENRAQSTIAALKSRLALNAVAFRDGEWTTFPAAGLVPGDIERSGTHVALYDDAYNLHPLASKPLYALITHGPPKSAGMSSKIMIRIR